MINKFKVAMDILHQARSQIALIAGLLGQFVDGCLLCKHLRERIRVELPLMEDRLANELVIFLDLVLLHYKGETRYTILKD